MRVAVIANPVSGTGRAQREVAALAALLERRGHAVCIHWTQRVGHARDFAASLAPDTDVLVVAGGDGTVNETINGLVDPGRLPIAVMRVGTGNLLARELDLPRSAHGTAALLDDFELRRVDLGVVDQLRRFVVLLSAGVDAMVIRAIDETRSGTLGFRGYAGAIVQALRRYRVPRLGVTVDGAGPLPAALVIVANAATYAGFFRAADRARCDSGHLDVVVLKRGRLPALASYAWSAWRGRLSRRADVGYHTGQSVRIVSPQPVPVEVDGEFYGVTPVEVTVQAGVLPLCVPRPRPGR